MHTENAIIMRGNIEHVFALASAVEDWPRLLPHYRWVKILTPGSTERLVEMAAHRDGFPVHWTAWQRLDPVRHQIHFTHIRGISRGMEVTWFLGADGPQVSVRIVHDLTWGWAPVGPWFTRYIIGDLFVHHIASKTLHVMKQHVENMAAC